MTFNVRALNRIGQLAGLPQLLSAHNIDIVCVQEHWYHHSEEEPEWHDTGNGWTFVFASAWRNSVNAVIWGAGILVGQRTQKSLNGIEKIQPRMKLATFNGNPSTTNISYYCPTSASVEKDIETLYNELSSLVCSIIKHNVLIIGGNMNAQIGKSKDNKFSLHSLSNRNEEHLTDFLQENGLLCLNTKFQKRKGKLWTGTYAN